MKVYIRYRSHRVVLRRVNTFTIRPLREHDGRLLWLGQTFMVSSFVTLHR